MQSRPVLSWLPDGSEHQAREWGQLTTLELGRRLQRDPSMISRLAAAYAASRDAKAEAQVRQALWTRTEK